MEPQNIKPSPEFLFVLLLTILDLKLLLKRLCGIWLKGGGDLRALGWGQSSEHSNELIIHGVDGGDSAFNDKQNVSISTALR